MSEQKIPAGGQPAGGTTGAIFDNRTAQSIAQGGAGDKLAITAAYYARCGWHVFPLHTPIFTGGLLSGCTCGKKDCGKQSGKHPRTQNGVHDATSDPDTVRNWWDRWPGANIGLNCGASGLLILDFDTAKEDFAGGELLENLRNNYPTTTAQSGSGGYHLLYQQPDGDTLGNGRGKLPAGVDVRGHGGYIVLAPSGHYTGNEYRWEVYPAQLAPQPLPAFILDILKPKPKAAQPITTNGNGPRPSGNAPTAAELVNWAIKRAGAEGRNNAGFDLAVQLKDNGYSQTEAAGYILDYQRAVEHNKAEPYTEGEARGSLRSAYSKPARSPWTPTNPPAWLNPLPSQTTAQPIHTNGTGAHMDEPPEWLGADDSTPDEPPDAHRAAQTPGPGPSSPKIADRELFTDLGNARRFTRLHGPKFHYTQQWGWLAWTGQRWEMDSTGAVMRAAKDTAVGYYAEAAGKQDAAKRLNEQAAADGLTDPQRAKLAEDAGKLAGIAGAMNTWAKTCQGRARLESMVKLAESELPIATKTDDFNLKPWALNVQNGTVDLRTGKLQPHERGDLLTALAPVDYEPGALCPTWDKFLHRIMDGDTEMVDFLRRAIGYSLTGDVSEQKLFFPHGGGSNGKSTFITTLLSLLGQDYAAQAAPELLVVGKDRHPTEVADLYGKRLVASIEVEDGRRLAEGLVKQLTGGDKIKARLMRQDFFQFDPTHKMWLVANHKPVVKGTDYAIWRRILLIPFDVTITDEEKDPQLPAKLLAEGPGILAWAVRGCLEWQRQGLGVPDSVKRATAAYRGDSDTLALFLAECTVHVNTARTKASHLYARYEKWCKDNGEAPIGGTPFGRALTERGMGKETNYQGVFYLGLGLATEDQKPE